MSIWNRVVLAGLVLITSTVAQPVLATTIADNTGDFLSTYDPMLPQNGDLDVVSFSAYFNASANTFTFSATLAADIGTTPGVIFVIGLNRGAGLPLFAGIGVDKVLFDAAIGVQGDDGSAFAVTFPPQVVTPLATGATIDGATFTITVDAALLPSTGFGLTDYRVSFWPRLGLGDNSQISDFAPNNGTFRVPAPAAATLLLGGLLSLRRRLADSGPGRRW